MPDRAAEPRPTHRFDWRLWLLCLAAFVVVFGGEAAIDVVRSAGKANRPFEEVWPEIAGGWYSSIQAGACLARAAYCMLVMCLSVFILAIPFAASFYGPKLIAVYAGDGVNRTVIALAVLASAFTHFQTTEVWSELRLPGGGPTPADYGGFEPAIALGAGIVLVAVAWAALVPYALYAFRFLSPEVVIDRIEAAMRRDLARAASGRGGRARIAARLRQEAMGLGNLALRAFERADRDLALDGVRALGRTFRAFAAARSAIAARPLEPRREWLAGLSSEAFELVRADALWVGHLLLHQIALAYAAALARTPDAAAHVAAVALGVTDEAARRDDRDLLALALRFANTLIREALERADAAVVQDVVRAHRELLARLAARGDELPAETLVRAAEHLEHYVDVARRAEAHAAADVVALSLARTVELAAAHARLALAGVGAALARLADAPAGASGEALLKARALAASCLLEAGLAGDAGLLLARIAAAPAGERAAVRAGLAASALRTDAGREAFGAEPGLEFIPEPRRSRILELLERAGT